MSFFLTIKFRKLHFLEQRSLKRWKITFPASASRPNYWKPGFDHCNFHYCILNSLKGAYIRSRTHEQDVIVLEQPLKDFLLGKLDMM